MLHITYGSNGTFYVTTEDQAKDTSVDRDTRLRLLFKFTNDMTGAVKYAYGNSQVHYGSNMIYYRATKVRIDHNTTESIPLGRVNFKPYGYWYYEIYEVTYNGDIGTLTATNTPQEETGTSSDTSGVHGTVRGKVEEGKLYVTETSGSEQVKYTTHTETTTNYLYTN